MNPRKPFLRNHHRRHRLFLNFIARKKEIQIVPSRTTIINKIFTQLTVTRQKPCCIYILLIKIHPAHGDNRIRISPIRKKSHNLGSRFLHPCHRRSRSRAREKDFSVQRRRVVGHIIEHLPGQLLYIHERATSNTRRRGRALHTRECNFREIRRVIWASIKISSKSRKGSALAYSPRLLVFRLGRMHIIRVYIYTYTRVVYA